MYYPGLEGKNVLLIGGHSSIGQHVTKLFAQSGANIVIGARDLQRAEEVAAEARTLGKGAVSVLEVEATNWASLQRTVEETLKLGPLDVFYEGIGWGLLEHFLDLDPQFWDTIYERTFKCFMMAYKIVLPIMIRQRSGCFITLNSLTGRQPMPAEPVHGAFKCGLIYLAQALARDVASYGVRINVVAPGATPAEDLGTVSRNSVFHGLMRDRDAFDSLMRTFAATVPMQRLGEPANVAHAVLYLASPVTGAYQTGQVIGVDGGAWMPK